MCVEIPDLNFTGERGAKKKLMAGITAEEKRNREWQIISKETCRARERR
jgi:hypothetical protein